MEGVVKYIEKSVLHLFPRPFIQRVAGWCVPVMGLFYRGKGRICPICGDHFRKFMPYGYTIQREDALCPRCLSLERHRLLWLYLQRKTALLNTCPTLLHIAPEVALMEKLKKVYKDDPTKYLTADLESPLAKLHFDVQDIPLETETIDVIICNHLLEHVTDDKKALHEFYRILKKGGWGVVMCPVDETMEHTKENPSITSPKEREIIFGQYDHVRLYGKDYKDRLEKEGFTVENIVCEDFLSEQERVTHALGYDHIYIIRK